MTTQLLPYETKMTELFYYVSVEWQSNSVATQKQSILPWTGSELVANMVFG